MGDAAGGVVHVDVNCAASVEPRRSTLTPSIARLVGSCRLLTIGAPLAAQVVEVEGGAHKKVLQVVTVNVDGSQGVAETRGESLPIQNLKTKAKRLCFSSLTRKGCVFPSFWIRVRGRGITVATFVKHL